MPVQLRDRPSSQAAAPGKRKSRIEGIARMLWVSFIGLRTTRSKYRPEG